MFSVIGLSRIGAGCGIDVFDPSDIDSLVFAPVEIFSQVTAFRCGLLPVVVIDKPLSDRMASTIRHNRARGTHDIDLMVNIVKELKDCGQSDAWIMKHLGMDAEELLRLKQVSGLASLFADKEFSPADPEMV